MALPWKANPPASAADIERLRSAVAFDFPAGYLELLRRFNGGEGAFALPPLWLQLWSVDEVIDFARFKQYAWRFPEHLFFASNGVSEYLAMRRARGGALEIVTVELTLGLDSAQVIATDFETFAAAIGR